MAAGATCLGPGCPGTYCLRCNSPSRGNGWTNAINQGFRIHYSCQASDGGWPVNLADTESSASVSALAGMALLETGGKAAPCLAAERFVLRSFGKMPKPWILRVAEWMQSLDSSYVDQNYGGWSWNPETARWVEPTAYALLFLKKLNQFRYCGVISGD